MPDGFSTCWIDRYNNPLEVTLARLAHLSGTLDGSLTMALEFLAEGIGPIGRAIGSFIVGRIVPRRWRHAIEPESQLADAIGLAVLLIMLVAAGAIVVAYYAIGSTQ